MAGTGSGGFDALSQAILTIERRDICKLSPFTVPSFLPDVAAGRLSIRHGFRGPPGAPATACAAGAQAVADAARMLRAGEADMALCGGAKAALVRDSLGGFTAARALAPGHGGAPHAASRPFDAGRAGFVMGEGAGMPVIETPEHARARGAVPLAKLAGRGPSADAHHLTAAPQDGAGAQAAMRAALADAGLAPAKIAHVNAHATATPPGDMAEARAPAAVFGTPGPAVSATKRATGHLLGAAGGVESVFSVMALASGVLPPTLNLDTPDPAAAPLDIVGPQARRSRVTGVMSNAVGFGGVNVSLIFRAL